jgi:hypothetical protein
MFPWKKKKENKNEAATAASAVPEQEPALDSTDELFTVRPVQANPYRLPPEADRQADAIIQTILDLRINILDDKEWNGIVDQVSRLGFPEVINQRMLQKIQDSIPYADAEALRADAEKRQEDSLKEFLEK